MKTLITTIALGLILPGFSQVYQTATAEHSSGTVWHKFMRNTNTFDNSGFVTSTLSEAWNMTNSSWMLNSLTHYTNTPDGNASQSLFQTYNSVWTDLDLTNYTYSPSGKILVILTEKITGSSFQNSGKITYNYDLNDHLLQILDQYWDVSSSTWINMSRRTYTNNAMGLPTDHLREVWQNGNWASNTATTSSYDVSGKKTSNVYATWSSIDNAWVTHSKDIYTYDANNYLVNTLRQSWIPASSTWNNRGQTNYVNHPTGSIHQEITQYWRDTFSIWQDQQKITYTYPGEVTSLQEYDAEHLAPVYFDLQGNEIERRFGEMIIEQSGRSRRKIIILK